MSNRSRGEALAVGAEPFHERCLFFGRGEGRLERIAREEDALVRGEAAFSSGGWRWRRKLMISLASTGDAAHARWRPFTTVASGRLLRSTMCVCGSKKISARTKVDGRHRSHRGS